MGADPKPDIRIPFFPGQGTVTEANSDRPIFADRFEMKRGMRAIFLPKLVVLDGKFSDFSRQSIEQLPEAGSGQRVHEGNLVQRPALYSVKASSANASSLPASASRAICASHLAARYSSNQRENSTNSCGLSRWMVSSAISTELITDSIAEQGGIRQRDAYKVKRLASSKPAHSHFSA